MSHEEPLAHLQALVDLLRVGTARDTPEAVLKTLVPLLRPDIACYYQPHRNRSKYQLSASYPPSFWGSDVRARFAELSGVKGALGEAVRTKVAVVIDDPVTAEVEGRYQALHPDVKFEVVVPLLSRGQLGGSEHVVGVMAFDWFEPPTPPTEAVALLKTAGQLVSSATTSMVSAEFSARHINFLKAITPPANENPDGVYRRFLAALAELLPTKLVCLWLYDRDNDAFVIRSYYPETAGGRRVSFGSFDRTVVPADDSVVGAVLKARVPVVVPNLDSDASFKNRRFAAEHGLRWAACFPVLEGSTKPVGVITLTPDGEPDEFDEETQSFYQDYASYLAYTSRTSNLLLQESLLSTFGQFFRELATFEADQRSWDAVARLVAGHMGCQDCSIFLRDDDGLLRLKGSTGMKGVARYDDVTYRVGEGLTGYTFEREEPLLYYRDRRMPYHARHVSKFRERASKSDSIVMAPLVAGKGRPIGVVRCVNKTEVSGYRLGRFSPEDLDALSGICRLVATIYSKVEGVRARDLERERSWRGLHHELVGPVDNIQAHLEWVERNLDKCVPGSDDAKRLLLKCKDIRQISVLLENVVFLMDPIEGASIAEPSVVSPFKLVSKCAGFLYNEGRSRGISVQIERMDHVPPVLVGENEMMRVVYNLIRNALKYVDPDEPSRYVRISAEEGAGGRVRLAFEDNGIGVPPGEEELIFEKFVRGSNARALAPVGEGLGLYFSRTLIQHYQGELTLFRPHRPTVFLVTLPAGR